MTILRTATFRTFHQGVAVTLSLRAEGAGFVVRCQPRGGMANPKHDTACATLAEAETVYTRKFALGMTGEG